MSEAINLLAVLNTATAIKNVYISLPSVFQTTKLPL
jgi:hypothetical protein